MNRDLQGTAAVTIFKKLNPHTGWIKKRLLSSCQTWSYRQRVFSYVTKRPVPVGSFTSWVAVAWLSAQTWLLQPEGQSASWTDLSTLSSSPKDTPYVRSSPVPERTLCPLLLKQKCWENYQLAVSPSICFCSVSTKEQKDCHAASTAWGTNKHRHLCLCYTSELNLTTAANFQLEVTAVLGASPRAASRECVSGTKREKLLQKNQACSW